MAPLEVATALCVDASECVHNVRVQYVLIQLLNVTGSPTLGCGMLAERPRINSPGRVVRLQQLSPGRQGSTTLVHVVSTLAAIERGKIQNMSGTISPHGAYHDPLQVVRAPRPHRSRVCDVSP